MINQTILNEAINTVTDKYNATVQVSEKEALEFFKQFIGSTNYSLFTITPQKMLKKHRETKEPNPYTNFDHYKVFRGRSGYNYENRVNKEREKANLTPDFVAQAHKWAEHKAGAVFHRKSDKGGNYIAYELHEKHLSKYDANGIETNYSQMKHYVSASKGSNPVNVQFVKLENLVWYVHNRTMYIINRN